MKTSVVVMERTMTAEVEVSHPPEWSEADVKAAVNARQIDINGAAPYWGGGQRTVIKEIRFGESMEPDDKAEMCGPGCAPVELVDEDLDGDA